MNAARERPTSPIGPRSTQGTAAITNVLTDLARESPVNKSTHAIDVDDKLMQKRRIQTAVDRDVGTSCDNRNEAENQHTYQDCNFKFTSVKQSLRPAISKKFVASYGQQSRLRSICRDFIRPRLRSSKWSCVPGWIPQVELPKIAFIINDEPYIVTTPEVAVDQALLATK